MDIPVCPACTATCAGLIRALQVMPDRSLSFEVTGNEVIVVLLRGLAPQSPNPNRVDEILKNYSRALGIDLWATGPADGVDAWAAEQIVSGTLDKPIILSGTAALGPWQAAYSRCGTSGTRRVGRRQPGRTWRARLLSRSRPALLNAGSRANGPSQPVARPVRFRPGYGPDAARSKR